MYSIFKEILVVLYYIASIGLFTGILISIKQLKIMQSDIKTKNKRASIEKSIEYLNWFATEFIPEVDDYTLKLEGKRINVYPDIDKRTFKFNDTLNLRSRNVKNSIKIKHDNGAIYLCNQLEFFSAAMVSGLADEELAFNPLAESFCQIIELNYDVYCYARRHKDTLYTNTIKLYKIWKDRLESINLQKEKELIEQKMSKIEHEKVKVLGLD